MNVNMTTTKTHVCNDIYNTTTTTVLVSETTEIEEGKEGRLSACNYLHNLNDNQIKALVV